MTHNKLTPCVAFFLMLLPALVFADTWPGFRGATGNGISQEKNLPVSWSASKGVLWKAALPGRGNSSPAVTSDRIYLTTQESDTSLSVLSLDRKTGRILWKKNVGKNVLTAAGPKNLYEHRHNPATPTASADETGVFAFFGSGTLLHLDRDGKEVWRHDMNEEFGAYKITFGMGSSPRLWGDLVYLPCMTKGPSYVAAFDKKTGKLAWSTTRSLPAKDDGPDSYSTPLVHRTKAGDQLLVSGSDHIDSYDLKTGKRLWFSGGLTIESPFGRIIASPAASEDVIIATAGNPGGGGLGHSLALRSGGSGDISQSHRLWEYAKTSPDSSTPVCVGNNVYMFSGEGIASCVDLKTGQLHWRKRLMPGPVHASLVAGDGKIYFLNIAGECVIMAPGNEAKILATNTLPGDFYATPAISEGVIYFRTNDSLYAVDGK